MLRNAAISSSLRPTLRGVGPIVAIVLVAGLLIVAAGAVPQIQWARDMEADRVQHAAEQLNDVFGGAQGDALLIGREQKVREALTGDAGRVRRLQADWQAFLETKPHFDQIRLLDARGREVVRVERSADGRARIVPDAELQDKGDRPYFTRAEAAPDGVVSVSALDLNVEHGEIERPYKPVLRYSITMRDGGGRLLGVTVLNVLARPTLEQIRAILSGSPGSYGVVNAAGYALLSKDPADEWAFMLPGGAKRTLARSQPDLWRSLETGEGRTRYAGARLISRVRLCSALRGCGGGAAMSESLAFDSPDQPWTIYTATGLLDVLGHNLLDWKMLPLGVALTLIVLLGAMAARAAWHLARTVAALTASRDTLRRHSAVIEGFIDNNPIFMFVKDLEGRYLLANKAYQKYVLKGAQGSVLGRAHAELVPPDIVREVQYEEAQVVRSGQPLESERATPEDFGRRFLHVLKFPMRDADGKVNAVGTIARDITDRVLADEARLETERRFRAILVAAPDAIVIADANGGIAVLNPAAARMFGHVPSALEGAPMLGLIAPGEQAAMAARLQRAREAAPGELQHDVQASQGLRADGTTFPIEVTSSALMAGNERWSICVMRDVSERHRLELQLRQGQKLEALGQLTGGIAHDFNNLLAIVSGNLELLERNLAADEGALKRVRTAQRAAQRGADLTRRLLAFARRQPLAPAAVRLEEMVAGVGDMVTHALGPNIKFETTLDRSVPAVFVDVGGLETAILNLAINARDAMPEGGTLRIATALFYLDDQDFAVRAGTLKSGRYAVIRITDTGEGMPPEVKQRAFEPFFTTKGRGKGTGLGLAMVYGFVKQSGGDARIYSEPGKGTAVSLFLPLAAKDAATGEKPPPKKHVARPGATALVVDDEPDLLDIGAAYLEEMGYRVLRAGDAAQALEVAGREPGIDLLVTDVVMPGALNGVDLARRLRAERPGIAVILSSGFTSQAVWDQDGTRIDAPLLNKPYVHSEFVRLLNDVMGEGLPA